MPPVAVCHSPLYVVSIIPSLVASRWSLCRCEVVKEALISFSLANIRTYFYITILSFVFLYFNNIYIHIFTIKYYIVYTHYIIYIILFSPLYLVSCIIIFVVYYSIISVCCCLFVYSYLYMCIII